MKKFLAAVSAIFVMGTFSLSVSADEVFYSNDIKEIKDGNEYTMYLEFNNGTNIAVTEKNNFTVNYEVDSAQENISNDYFGISAEYTMKKISLDDKCICRFELETEKEMEELFTASKELYKQKKINDAYISMDIKYSPFEYVEKGGETLVNILTVNYYGSLMTYLNDIPQLIVIGDANGDNELNVRDCAFIASLLSQGKETEISDIADFNEDGMINVRDAAAIAGSLAAK